MLGGREGENDARKEREDNPVMLQFITVVKDAGTRDAPEPSLGVEITERNKNKESIKQRLILFILAKEAGREK